MKVGKLSQYLSKLEENSSRIEITKVLASLFKEAKASQIDKIVYLILGSLAPGYEGKIFNLADKLMLQVLSRAYSINLKTVRSFYKEIGDLGSLAQNLADNKTSKISKNSGKYKDKSINIDIVYNSLLQISKYEGSGSQEQKIVSFVNLLEKLDPLSVRYIVRIPIGKLRLGFSDITILDALSWMKYGNKKASPFLKKAYHVLPDVGLLAKKVKKFGIEKATRNIRPLVGVPVLPMLAQRLKSSQEMIKKMGKVIVEPKFDGLRIQVHYQKTKNKKPLIKAYTRNLNETSWMFPELKSIYRQIKSNKVILDAEAIGIDESQKTLANFQTTMTRRRKHKIGDFSSKVPITFYVFDILALDDESLINAPLIERKKYLASIIKKGKSLKVIDYIVTSKSSQINTYMNNQLSQNLEGIIVKKINSKYVSGRAGWRWVKMKEIESSIAKLSDTLDCVVMGYYVGKGKRTKFGLGGFLVGVKDKNIIKTLTKIGTGITDSKFHQLKNRLDRLVTSKKPKEYGMVDAKLNPDFWVEPNLVVEIAADEITKSPNHSSAFALRFPRLVRFRDDKLFSQSTTLSEVKQMFKLQNI